MTCSSAVLTAHYRSTCSFLRRTKRKLPISAMILRLISSSRKDGFHTAVVARRSTDGGTASTMIRAANDCALMHATPGVEDVPDPEIESLQTCARTAQERGDEQEARAFAKQIKAVMNTNCAEQMRRIADSPNSDRQVAEIYMLKFADGPDYGNEPDPDEALDELDGIEPAATQSTIATTVPVSRYEEAERRYQEEMQRDQLHYSDWNLWHGGHKRMTGKSGRYWTRITHENDYRRHPLEPRKPHHRTP